MAQEIPETAYVPEVEEDARKERERRVVQEGTALWRRRKEELQRQKHREQRELQQVLENYSPWGKPGGGAPCPATLRKKNVPLEPPEPPERHNFGQGWTSNSTIRRFHGGSINRSAAMDRNKFPDETAEPGVPVDAAPIREQTNRHDQQARLYHSTGSVGLLPLLTSRRYDSRCLRHRITDATRSGFTTEPLRALGAVNRGYLAELEEQIRRKSERASEERRTEEESCRRHFDTWRKLWGRPGHGAPIDHAHRNNLYDILYRSAIY